MAKICDAQLVTVNLVINFGDAQLSLFHGGIGSEPRNFHRWELVHIVVSRQRRHIKNSCRDTLYQNIRSHYLRSEEHTSELQSRFEIVCRLLLEKKKRR